MVIHEILWESYCFISSQSLLTSEIMSVNINRLIYIIQGFSSYSHNCVKTLCQVLALVPPLYPQPCFMLLGSGLGKPHFPFALWLPVRIFAGFRLAKDHRSMTWTMLSHSCSLSYWPNLAGSFSKDCRTLFTFPLKDTSTSSLRCSSKGSVPVLGFPPLSWVTSTCRVEPSFQKSPYFLHSNNWYDLSLLTRHWPEIYAYWNFVLLIMYVFIYINRIMPCPLLCKLLCSFNVSWTSFQININNSNSSQ